jgi:hypothetical protein
VDPKKVLLHIDSKNCRYKMQILGLELWMGKKYPWLGSSSKDKCRNPCDKGQIFTL